MNGLKCLIEVVSKADFHVGYQNKSTSNYSYTCTQYLDKVSGSQ